MGKGHGGLGEAGRDSLCGAEGGGGKGPVRRRGGGPGPLGRAPRCQQSRGEYGHFRVLPGAEAVWCSISSFWEGEGCASLGGRPLGVVLASPHPLHLSASRA